MKIEIAEFIPSDVTEIASLALAMTWFTEYLPSDRPSLLPKYSKPVENVNPAKLELLRIIDSSLDKWYYQCSRSLSQSPEAKEDSARRGENNFESSSFWIIVAKSREGKSIL